MLMHASSGELWHSSGELWRDFQNLREAARSWILGHNVFLWSCKVKIYILGAFGTLSPALANRSGKLWQSSGELWQSHTAPSKSHKSPSIRYYTPGDTCMAENKLWWSKLCEAIPRKCQSSLELVPERARADLMSSNHTKTQGRV